MNTRVELGSHRPTQSCLKVDPAGVSELLPATEPAGLPSARDLLLQGLLHLPRLASSEGMIDRKTASAEVTRLQMLRAGELEPYAALAAVPAPRPDLHELEVRLISATDAEPIASHFHYLHSFRAGCISVAAVYGSQIAALCSISPFDLWHVADELPVLPEDVAVVSRVFAFDWAPRNTISFLLARAEKLCPVRMLLTYLNPNMGFTGASYRSANWQLVGLETGTRYAYLDRRYITDREMALLPRATQRRVEFSRMSLLPLEIYGRLLERSPRHNLESRRPFTVARPLLPATIPA